MDVSIQVSEPSTVKYTVAEQWAVIFSKLFRYKDGTIPKNDFENAMEYLKRGCYRMTEEKVGTFFKKRTCYTALFDDNSILQIYVSKHVVSKLFFRIDAIESFDVVCKTTVEENL